MTGDDLSAARIIEDALMCYEVRLKQALDLHDGLAAELESSAEAIREEHTMTPLNISTHRFLLLDQYTAARDNRAFCSLS